MLCGATSFSSSSWTLSKMLCTICTSFCVMSLEAANNFLAGWIKMRKCGGLSQPQGCSTIAAIWHGANCQILQYGAGVALDSKISCWQEKLKVDYGSGCAFQLTKHLDLTDLSSSLLHSFLPRSGTLRRKWPWSAIIGVYVLLHLDLYQIHPSRTKFNFTLCCSSGKSWKMDT